MKGFIMSGLCCLALFPSSGQKHIERTLAWTSGRPITLTLQFGNRIRISSWDRQEMKVEISVDINHNSLNDALKVGFSEGKEGLSVSSDLDKAMLDKADCQECQDSSGCSVFNNKKTCMEITYEIHVPSAAPVNVQTINANLEIYDTRGPLQAKTISGFIDMTASSRLSANILMNTITGDCFSDFIINDGEVSTKNPAGAVGVRIKGTINGGGVPVDLSSISNNIYLRKDKAAASGVRPHPIVTWSPAALPGAYTSTRPFFPPVSILSAYSPISAENMHNNAQGPDGTIPGRPDGAMPVKFMQLQVCGGESLQEDFPPFSTGHRTRT